MAFDIVSALKIVASVSKGPEVQGLLYRAAGELRRLQEIEAGVLFAVMAETRVEKLAAWEKVKELCQVQVSGSE